MSSEFAAFSTACRDGDLEMARDLYVTGKVDIHGKGNEAFCFACSCGRFEMAQWLLSLGIDIHANNDKAFQYACRYNQLEIARWLLSLGGVDIHANDDEAFTLVCAFGKLKTAQWLHSLGIDTHTIENEAFRWACNMGQLDIARWLHNLGGISIDALRDRIAVLAEAGSNPEMLEWLESVA